MGSGSPTYGIMTVTVLNTRSPTATTIPMAMKRFMTMTNEELMVMFIGVLRSAGGSVVGKGNSVR